MTLPKSGSIEQAKARGAKCDRCPLNAKKNGLAKNGPVMGQIFPGKLIGIGEAPGPTEVSTGEPFSGWSGARYDDALQLGGGARALVPTTNALLCKQPNANESLDQWLTKAKRKSGKKWVSPFDCCLPRLRLDIEQSKAEVALTMGKCAQLAVGALANLAYSGQKISGIPIRTVNKRTRAAEKHTPLQAITTQRGHPYALDRSGMRPVGKLRTMLPAYAARRARHLGHVIQEDMARAVELAAGGGAITWRYPKFYWTTLKKKALGLIRKLHLAKRHGPIVVDIETDGIDRNACRVRCIGIGAQIEREDGSTYYLVGSIPIRRKTGKQWFADRNLAEIKEALRAMFDDPDVELSAHYSIFDFTVLEREGFVTDKHQQVDCTAVMHHNTKETDSPHGVDHVSSRVGLITLWKGDVDHKAVGGMRADRELALYNCKDVYNQIKIWEWCKEQIKFADASWQQRVDRAKGPVVKNMANRGFIIDNELRRELHEKMRDEKREFAEVMQSIVGTSLGIKMKGKKHEGKIAPFNPRSWQQVGKWLFDLKGYDPVLNKEGYEPEDEEDWSTSTPALMALQDDSGVDGETDAFINNLLFYRSRETLDARYLRKLPVRRDPTLPKHLRIIRTTFNIHVVPSGRLSSSDPINLQNWPSQGLINLREMVVCPDGYVLVSIDGEQLEARLWAIATGAQLMLNELRREVPGEVKVDIHSKNAAAMWSAAGASDFGTEDVEAIYQEIMRMRASDAPLPSGSQFDKEYQLAKYMRLCAKCFHFMLQYGGDWEKAWKVMRAERDKQSGKRTFEGLERSTARAWYAGWSANYPEQEPWAERVDAGCYRNGFVGKRRRWFPGTPNKQFAPRNHVVQSEAAEVMDRAMIRAERRLRPLLTGKWEGLIGQVHDELLWRCKEEHAAEVVAVNEEEMRYRNYKGAGFDLWGAADVTRIWTGPDVRSELPGFARAA